MSALSDLQSAESSAVSDQTATTSDHPHIYLYDPTVEMPSTCLPTNKQVLNRFLHLRFIEHKAEKDALHLLHEQVIEIWNRCNVETAQPKTVLNRLQLMLDPYKQLITLMKKNQYKKGMRAHYFDALERLFDIRKSQRGRRSVSPPLSPSPLPFVPISEIEKQSRSPPLFSESPPPQPDRRSKRLLDRQSKSEIPKKKPFDGFGYSSDDDIGAAPDEYSYESSIESDEDDEEYMAHQPPRTIRRHHVFSARFCEICKTRNVSVRTATQLIQTFVSEAGLPADRYMMSTSSMKRQRSRAKFSREDEVIESFRMERVIVHIDLKLIRFDDYSVNHVVVSASFGARSQVIGIRMMLDEQKNAVEQPTGADVADAVLDAINLYCVQSELVAFCCSPVPACLDFESGAMSVLRDHFPRQAALTFSCRRQMYGQVLTAVFDECFGSSFNEWDSLCTKFRNDWEQICTCKPASTVHSYERVMSPDDRDALQAEVSNCLDRDSDRELAQLCCMFLTGQFNFSFRNMRSLGNRNPRNLMIIALKMHLFRHHFILADEKSEKIYRFCSFVVFCFARFWFHAPKAIYAPNSDLTFLKLCYRYRFYDRSVADVAIYAMKKNVSYLRPEMIGLALFDEQVSMIDKDLIRNKILNSDLPDLDISSAISSISVDRIPTLRLDEFASKASLKLFKALEIDTDFLQMPANNLHHYYRFAELIPIVGLLEQLNVTNDSIHYDVGIVKFVRDIPRIRHYETLQPLIKSIEKNQSKFPNERQMVRQLDLLE